MNIQIKTAPTVIVSIYIAGDIAIAKQTCREYCFEVGACVTVEALDFIYTGGEERGVRVGFINYPRFPKDLSEIVSRATDLGYRLLNDLCQNSFSIVDLEQTTWFSRRGES